jgi:hypothetical protein
MLSIDVPLEQVNDAMTSLTREFIISFFPNLYEYNLVSGGSNIEDDPFVKIMQHMNVEQSDASNDLTNDSDLEALDSEQYDASKADATDDKQSDYLIFICRQL